jgi:hypothetical protein
VSIIVASPIVWNALQHSNADRAAWSGTTTTTSSSVFHYPGNNNIIATTEGSEGGGGMTFTYNVGFIQLVLVAMGAHVLMAFAAYRVLRDVLAGGDNVFTYPGNLRGSGGGSSRRRRRKLTVSEIADIVRKVPVEEFVSNEDLRSGECSVTRMKRMMTNRGATEIAAKCIERDDLVCELEKIRKFNDECSICAEELWRAIFYVSQVVDMNSIYIALIDGCTHTQLTQDGPHIHHVHSVNPILIERKNRK